MKLLKVYCPPLLLLLLLLPGPSVSNAKKGKAKLSKRANFPRR
jgi:hypothetical protein